MDNSLHQLNQYSTPALPLSKRINSIFREFVIGMKLAYLRQDNQDIELDVMASHNLRLLQKRLTQIPEYEQLLSRIIQTGDTAAELWTSLFDDREINCGFLKIQANQNMPCANHPGFQNLYLLLSGAPVLKQYCLRHKENSEVFYDIQSSRNLNIGDAVFYRSDGASLTNLSTSNKACVLLNVQLSGQNKH